MSLMDSGSYWAGRAVRSLPIFWPLWAAAISGRPILRAKAMHKGHSQLSVLFDSDINRCNVLIEIAFQFQV